MNKSAAVTVEDARRLEIAGLWLLRLQEERVSPADMSAWIDWCESDAANLRAFEQLQSMWRAAAEHQPTPDMVARLMSDAPVVSADPARKAAVRLNDTAKRNVQIMPRRLRRVTALAAAVAVAAVGGLLVFTSKQGSQPLIQVAATDRIHTPLALNRTGLLPDGSTVDIGASTLLDVSYSTRSRHLELRDGQAFFQVKPDRVRPFVVDAGELEIKALGTAFDVRRTAEQVVVTVEDGSVQIAVPQGSVEILAAGQQLIFQPLTGVVRRAAVNPAVTLAWRSGRLEFTGDTLDVVVASVNRYSRHPVILDDPELGRLVFTGTVFVESIDASLEAMDEVFPIHVRRTANGEIRLMRRR